MNAEIKAKWIEALRSGKYPQGKRALQSRDGYCCLGVLCVVAGIPITGDGGAADGHGYDPILALIGDHYHSLIVENDGGTPFSQIADNIEQNL